MMQLSLALVAAYLVGSVSPSYLLGKWLKGIDLREHGSGNLGATNVFRVLGKGPGLAALLCDILKGWLPVKCFPLLWPRAFELFPDPFLYPVLIGASAIAGHNWTIFLRFRGGKGVATSGGVFLALSPQLCLLGFFIWALIRQVTRSVALGSLAAAFSLPIFSLLLRKSPTLTCFAFLIAISTLYTHRSNLRKIFFSKDDSTD